MASSSSSVMHQALNENVGPMYTEPENSHEEWAKCNLLSLDGGGIRGYWTLLALEILMEYIAEVEEEWQENILHSFWPEDWPDNFPPLEPITTDEQNRFKDAANTREKLDAISKTRRYYPCHYFDYIGGSSTGALIAIMLGRFRMSVPECIREYENLGGKVFGKPRHFTALNFPLVNRTKYKASRLEKVFKDVTLRRSESMRGPHEKTTFPFGRGLCKTFVTTFQSDSDNKVLAKLYLIRSYNHTQRRSPESSKKPTRSGTMSTSRSNTGYSGGPGTARQEPRKHTRGINRGPAPNLEIWEVARAATAAPFYFEPLRLKKSASSSYMLFRDGGFSYTNNPTKEGFREIVETSGPESIGTVVSVGTARMVMPPRERGFLATFSHVKNIVGQATDPEKVHVDMEEDARTFNFPYFRLNDPGGLDVELDEWKPNGPLHKKDSGKATLKTIRDGFNKWVRFYNTPSQLRECAETLVRRRRIRTTDRPQWERYAIGSRFTCRLKSCKKEEEFCTYQDFGDHLRLDHQMSEENLKTEINERREHLRYLRHS